MENNFATRIEMEKRAIKNLTLLSKNGLSSLYLKEFVDNGTVFVFERTTRNFATSYFANKLGGQEDIEEIIKDFEKDNGLVYLVTREKTEFGEIADLWFVTKYKEDWHLNDIDIDNSCGIKHAFVKAVNLTDNNLSDMGTISFDINLGTIIRTDL